MTESELDPDRQAILHLFNALTPHVEYGANWSAKISAVVVAKDEHEQWKARIFFVSLAAALTFFWTNIFAHKVAIWYIDTDGRPSVYFKNALSDLLAKAERAEFDAVISRLRAAHGDEP